MAQSQPDRQLRAAAADPSTPRATLADLAYDHEKLRPLIALNPSTYEGLLDWLRELEDPAVDAALAQREEAETSDKPDDAVPVERTIVAPPPASRTTTAAAPQETACEACDAKLRPTAHYCGNCGTHIPGRPAYLPPAADRSRAYLYAAIAGTAVIVIVVIGIAIAQVVSNVNQLAMAAAESGNSTSSDVNTNSDTQTTNTSTGVVTPTPAPVQAYYFRSKSGNITCEITQDAAVCNQRTIAYTAPSDACQSGIPGVTVGVNSSGVEWPCLYSALPAGAVLPYDQPIVELGYTCVIDYDAGVKCTNQDTDGFTMAYTAGVSTF